MSAWTFLLSETIRSFRHRPNIGSAALAAAPAMKTRLSPRPIQLQLNDIRWRQKYLAEGDALDGTRTLNSTREISLGRVTASAPLFKVTR